MGSPAATAQAFLLFTSSTLAFKLQEDDMLFRKTTCKIFPQLLLGRPYCLYTVNKRPAYSQMIPMGIIHSFCRDMKTRESNVIIIRIFQRF
jgi:hypothetical protein